MRSSLTIWQSPWENWAMQAIAAKSIKNDQARYTYSYKCEARAFVDTLATNEFFKSRLLGEMKRVIDLLSDPFCELFSLLIINYDLIEVIDGRCWPISRRDFVDGAIEEQQVGKISPRAFWSFDSARDPDPKYFREVLENSLSPQEMANFCDDFLKLLLYNKKTAQRQGAVFGRRCQQWKDEFVHAHSRPHQSRQGGHGDKAEGVQ